MFIISIVVATLQNVVKGTEGNAQRFVNSGAWFLVLMLILWILFIDREAKLRLRFHSMYRALRKRINEKKDDGGEDIEAQDGDAEAERGVRRDGTEKGMRRKELKSRSEDHERAKIDEWMKRLEMIKNRWRPQDTRKWRI